MNLLCFKEKQSQILGQVCKDDFIEILLYQEKNFSLELSSFPPEQTAAGLLNTELCVRKALVAGWVLAHVTKPSGLVNWHFAEEKQTACIFMNGGSCASWRKAPK